MKKWEYEIITLSKVETAKLFRAGLGKIGKKYYDPTNLNEAGEEGWEAVNFIKDENGGYKILLKREK